MGIIKDGPDIHPSQKTYTVLMRSFIGLLILVVVALVALSRF